MIYFIKCREFIKIGKANSLKYRLMELSIGNPFELTIIDTIQTANEKEDILSEGLLHKYFSSRHHKGEWFRGGRIVYRFIKSLEGLTSEEIIRKISPSNNFLEPKVVRAKKPKSTLGQRINNALRKTQGKSYYVNL